MTGHSLRSADTTWSSWNVGKRRLRITTDLQSRT